MAEAPVRRAYQIYLYAVCFVAVLVVMFGTAQALYGVVRIALPEQTSAAEGFVGGPFGGGFGPVGDPGEQERERGVAQLLENGLLAVLAGLVFAFHWRRAALLRDELEGSQEGGSSPG